MPRHPRSTRPVALVLIIGLVLAVVAGGCGDDDGGTELVGLRIEPMPDVAGVSLPDVTDDGADLAFRADDDGLLLVYFGYTSCPDVCPTTLADVRTALRGLDGAEADRIALAMATIDPARDTDEVLTGYVQSFVPDALALRTDDDARLLAAADAFGASFGVETNDEGEPEVSHSGFLYAVDDDGRVVITWPFGVTADEYRHDLEILLDEV